MKPLNNSDPALSRRMSRSRRRWSIALTVLLSCVLVLSVSQDTLGNGQNGAKQSVQAPLKPGEYLAVLPTATVPADKPTADAGWYKDVEAGVAFTYPIDWQTMRDPSGSTKTMLASPSRNIVLGLISATMSASGKLEDMAQQVYTGLSSTLDDVRILTSKAYSLFDKREAWYFEFTAKNKNGVQLHGLLMVTMRGNLLVAMFAVVDANQITALRSRVEDVFRGLTLKAPRPYGIPRDQAIFMVGAEANNPRLYDPATGHGNNYIFSSLVMLSPQLEVLPDLAESWEISPDGKVYTFHLRRNARFHNGRPVKAGDFVYSWERAADPATKSDTVLTYLGDIVGLADKHAGKAKSISGLKVIDDHTLQVTIDAPKPYFLMKLTYGTSSVLDRANVESGSDWYRTPNGTGPYKLIRWDVGKTQLYERNSDFYLTPPAVPYIVVQMYAGVGIRLYETGDVDISSVYSSDAERVRDPAEPLNADLHEGVSMCTSRITFDVKQAPFDDPKVRQAFALAVDRERYVDVVEDGEAIPAHGLYPPALPGFRSNLRGLDFDPQVARQRLAESRYGSADKLPPIIFTSSGFGSAVDPDIAFLADMWQKNLGVTIQVQNLEPDKAQDEMHAGRHGQLFSDGWCADYPDPENFADALYRSGAQQNLGNYSNARLDTLLDKARVGRDVTKRMEMYGQAEQIIVDDAASIFLSHRLSFALVKPYIKGYTLTPIDVPLNRYLSLDPSEMK